jgi:hypothetical protein
MGLGSEILLIADNCHENELSIIDEQFGRRREVAVAARFAVCLFMDH